MIKSYYSTSALTFSPQNTPNRKREFNEINEKDDFSLLEVENDFDENKIITSPSYF